MILRSQLTQLFFVLFSIPWLSLGQYNTSVVAEILITENTEFTELKANARNVTELNQDLSFVFSVISTEKGQSNPNTNKKEEGFSLAPFDAEVLAETTVNKKDKSKIIVLFLIYDYNKELIGKARWAQNETTNKKPIIVTKDELNRYEDPILSGIVTEDTRTKPGRDFYRLFYSEYFLSQLNAEEIISVKELLALGRNTKIEVRIGSTLVSQFYLRPKEDFLKQMVKGTMANISRYLQNKKNINQQIERY